MKPIALFSDLPMMPGLHVTLLSLLESLPEEGSQDVEIYLFLDRVPACEQTLLRETYQQLAKRAVLKIVDYSPTAPVGDDLLHGNQTTYGRLRLAELLPDARQCVYLDCDLVVNRSVVDLFDLFDGEHVLLVDGTGVREQSYEKGFFQAAGLDLAGPCFNSGVMGIDLDLWRERDLNTLCHEAALKYRGMLPSADQSLLNVVLHDSFKDVGHAYNTDIFPWSPSVNHMEPCIYHFVGSPKPWDFLGCFSSNHYKMWHAIYLRTAIGKRSPMRYLSLKRTLHIAKLSLKSMINKCR